ncbi:DNA topoisomerase IV subunit A [Pusillimonas sp. CC-YST705]|uniref:DNA topoisomerase 4 subunit A n=1 Tax=Mesopusillimonas faecipullorum TaxID=2755040 RepID=A0ABS8CB51_9BURK|nr:DNA topoisomerase IV subunit A [Mesopusillimonas faecipullorum]MCB5363265.1 DNA topoisomerase IV subunit A [Mesopusillimonas faecipullorum]
MDGTQTGLFEEGGQGDDEALSLGLYAEQAYLDYAVSVVRGRALPEVADGQKPVQRRILYAMNAMGLGTGAKPVKSARVVGDVLGKYHPHGDQAAYDAMVRMAQSFSLRYPLIDGQGNFGSRDGDNAAAMRYTEARLTPFSRLLLDELNEGTVDFVPNYDGSQEEPQLLPARLPMVLLNGASGIAVGMATEMPPHNLREVAKACVALLKQPNLTDQAIADLVPGPDFPGGGQIISSPEDIAAIYASGRGSIKVRARWHFEEMARGQWQMVVDELPPGTSSQRVLEEIEERTNPKVKAGKKGLSTEQQNTKALMLGMLDAVRDESGKDDAVRLVFEPKTSRVGRDEFINLLLTQTSLESNASINLVCLGTDGRPGQRSLRSILSEWLQFRTATVTRRSRFRLDKVQDRIHVLEGRLVVHLNVDEVIATIREAEEPREALMQRFKLTERQAEDILEMRLRQLARLESIRIEQELAELRGQQSTLQGLLDDPVALRKLIVKEIEADAKQFGDDRRTLIETAERAVMETKVVDEPVTVVMSSNGWLRARQGHGHDTAQFSFKPGDGLYDARPCRSTDTLLALSETGRAYCVPVASLPSARGDGQPITSMIDLEAGTRVAHVLVGDESQRVLLGTAQGLGFLTRLKDMHTRQRAGKQFINLDDKAELLRPLYVQEGDTHVAMFTKSERLLVIALDEVRVLAAGGRGTTLMGLDDGDLIDQWVTFGPAGLMLEGVYRNRETQRVLTATELQAYLGKRARKGKALALKFKQLVLRRA